MRLAARSVLESYDLHTQPRLSTRRWVMWLCRKIAGDAPERARLHRGVQVVIGLAQAALEEADVLLEIASDGGPGDEQAIPLGGEHLDQLATAREERVERLDGLIWQRAGCGPHALGEQREDLGINRIGLGQLPRALAKSRTWRGLATTTGRPAVARAATSAAS